MHGSWQVLPTSPKKFDIPKTTSSLLFFLGIHVVKQANLASTKLASRKKKWSVEALFSTHTHMVHSLYYHEEK